MFPALTAAESQHPLGWLVGCWTAPDRSAREVWVRAKDDELSGFSVVVSDNSVVFHEVLNVRRREDGAWVYTAHPSGQSATSFVGAEVSDGHALFINPDHDYPQEIRYSRKAEHLSATISLTGGANPNSFNKIACRQDG